MLSEKILQVTTDAIARLEEMRRSGTPNDRIWASRNFTQVQGDDEYIVDIQVRLKK